jgi:hypothetical protein
MREMRDELARLILLSHFGETPGDAAERILDEEAGSTGKGLTVL